jgi:predicted MFS family arabinose efflux permease
MEMRMNLGRFRFPAAARLWLVYALFVVAGVSQAAIVPLLPRLSARFALSATETALLLALPGLATLAVSVPAGLAADRFGARRVTLLAGLLLCLSSLAQATPSLAALLAGRLAFGIGFGVVWTTGMAWLADLDTGDGGSLGPAVTCSSAGIMAGPAVGGMLAQFAGLSTAFVAVAALAAAVLVPLAAVPDGRRRAPGPDADRRADRGESGQAPPAHAGTATRGIASALRLLRRPGVGAAAAALMVSGAVSGVSQLLISSGLHHLGMSTGRIGLAFSAAAVCYIVASTVVVRLGRRAHTLRFNAVATTVLAVALFPALSGAGAAALIAALMLSAAPRAAVSTIAYSLASVPASEADAPDGEAPAADGEAPAAGGAGRDGLVFGLLNGAWAAAMVLMPLLAGAMEQRDGARAGYLAVILPACVVAAWLVTRSGSGSGSASASGAEGAPGLREAAALRGAAARAQVSRLIPRPDRSHPVRLAAPWTGRGKALTSRPSRSAGRHPARTIGRRLSRRDKENRHQ